jgi:hypothetical protein
MKSRAAFPTIDHVWLFAAAALIALRPLLTPIPPHDFWWHLATGRAIATTWQIPVVDAFSYTRAGEPFFNQSWLAQLLMYGIYQLGGVPLLLVAQAAVLALAYWIILRLCLLRGGGVQLSVGILLLTTMPLSFDNWNVRPQSYTFPIFAAFLYILTQYRLGRGNRLWLLPALMVLWVNLHGSFVLGGALVAITLGGEWLRRRVAARRERLAWATRPIGEPEDVLRRPESTAPPPLLPLLGWGALAALALVINPRGLGVLGYVRNLLSTSAVTSLVTEWAPPTIRDLGGVIFYLFLFLTIAVLAYARRRPDPVDMLLAAAFLWLSLGAVRNIVWFGMVATPLLVASLRSADDTGQTADGGRRPPKLGLPALNWALIGVLSLMLLLALPWVKPALDLPPELGGLVANDTPVAAVACMGQQAQRPQRLFNAMGYGSYLIWALPEQKVFIDPRIELYPFEQWRDYIAIGAGDANGRVAAQRYNFDALLLNAEEQEGLLKATRADASWRLVCEDGQSSYFVKQ